MKTVLVLFITHAMTRRLPNHVHVNIMFVLKYHFKFFTFTCIYKCINKTKIIPTQQQSIVAQLSVSVFDCVCIDRQITYIVATQTDRQKRVRESD